MAHLSKWENLTMRFLGVRQTYFRRGAGRSLNLQVCALQERQHDVKVSLKIVDATIGLFVHHSWTRVEDKCPLSSRTWTPAESGTLKINFMKRNSRKTNALLPGKLQTQLPFLAVPHDLAHVAFYAIL